jgi:RNA polymerase sigma-70 factor (ECF subfamily)
MEPDILGDLVERFEEAMQLPPGDPELPLRDQCLRKALNDQQLDSREVIEGLTDETIALAIQRDFFFREAYDEFFRRFEPQIRAWLMFWRVDYHLAFDLAQTLLMRNFMSRLRSYQPHQGPLRAYLRQATYHLRLEKQPPNFAPLPDELPQQRAAGPEEEAAAHEMEERLEAAMAGLCQELREVLELNYRENLSHTEIAERLNITTRSSQQRLFKARRALEQGLGLSLPPATRGRPRHDTPPTSA